MTLVQTPRISGLTPHKGGNVVSRTHRLSRTQDHNAAGSIVSIKNPNYHNGNRYCDVPACSSAPQYGVIYYVTFQVLTKIIFWDVRQFNPVH